MSLAEFRASLAQSEPPPGTSLALQALWWDARGDWTRSHGCVQQDESASGSIVHAYLHRKEGDLANAGYWYRRAGRPPFAGTLDAEWAALAGELLAG